MNNLINSSDVPLGFGMALAQNLTAMNTFASLSSQEQQQIIDRTHSVQSKQEMQNLVDSLVTGNGSIEKGNKHG